MRVIAGEKKHLPLKTVAGKNTRPTSDKIKETLFNILSGDLYEVRFLDLFAGTGGIGIEALSRGASYAVFVDNGRDAIKCIHDNLQFTKLEERSMVIGKDIKSAIHMLERQEPFDIVFMDPPYYEGYYRSVLELLGNSSVINEDSLIIVEAEIHENFDYLESIGYELLRRKEYKTNMHLFMKYTRQNKEIEND